VAKHLKIRKAVGWLARYAAGIAVVLVLTASFMIAGANGGIASLVSDLGSDDWSVRLSAAKAIGGMGSSGAPAVPALIEVLEDKSESIGRGTVAVAVAEALGRIGPEAADAVPVLGLALSDGSAAVRRAAADALGRIGVVQEASLGALIKALGDGEANVRLAAAQALGSLDLDGNAEAIAALIEATDEPSLVVRMTVNKTLDKLWLKGSKLDTMLIQGLVDQDVWIRRAAAKSLGRLGPKVVPDLSKALADPDLLVQLNAIRSLETIGPKSEEAVQLLASVLRSESRQVQLTAIAALGHIGPNANTVVAELVDTIHITDLQKEALRALCQIAPENDGLMALLPDLLRDSDREIREMATRLLAQAGDRGGPILREAFIDSDWTVRQSIIGMLSQLDANSRYEIVSLAKSYVARCETGNVGLSEGDADRLDQEAAFDEIWSGLERYLTPFDYLDIAIQRLAGSVAMCVGSSDVYVNGHKTRIDPGDPDLRVVEDNGEMLVPAELVLRWLDVDLVGNTAALESVRSRSNGAFIVLGSLAEALGKKVSRYRDQLIVLSDDEKVFDPARDSQMISELLMTFDRYRRSLPQEVGANLWVAVDGDDTWSGRLPQRDGDSSDGPFATLERARDEIRRMKQAGLLPDGGVAVNIRGGAYNLSRSFQLTAADSGTEAAPIIYRAYGGEDVRIIGGRKLEASDFTELTDPEMLERVSDAGKGKVVEVDLSALGIKHTGPFPNVFEDGGGVFELFYNNERMQIARWPNDARTTMKEVVVNGERNEPGVFVYRDDRHADWTKQVEQGGLWLRGWWRVGWVDQAIKVASIDTEKRQVTFAQGISLGIGDKYTRPKGSGNEPYYALNVFEELDLPGEWYLDFTTKKLYFWPPDDAIDEASILVSQLNTPVISLNGTSHVAFEHLIIEGSLGDGIVMSSGRNNLIAGCTIRNLGGGAVVIDGYGNGVVSSDMYNLGKGGIYLTGGDRRRLVPSNNYAINNHVHHYGVLQTQYSAGVDVRGNNSVGAYVAHNLIHDAPRDAILAAGNDHLFEFNEFYSTGFGSQDTGVFYSCLDWSIRGFVVRYNYLHDAVGGINPDDGATGFTVYGNVFAGDRIGCWVASGSDHHFYNNIFVKRDGPLFGGDDRGIGREYATNTRLIQGVKSINPKMPPWSEQYPQIVDFLENDPHLPHDIDVRNNLFFVKSGSVFDWKFSGDYLSDPDMVDVRDNFITSQDPGFVDAPNSDYRLRDDSVAYDKIPGFQPIPMDRIGLYIDQYRDRLPAPEPSGGVGGDVVDQTTESDTNFRT
jgi:HEAT repeat protein